MSRRVVPVSTLVRYLKQSMDADPVLHGVMIEGEISNMRRPYSGHWYFSLKDDRSSLPCVMFASANRRVSFDPRNGDKVIVKGDVTVYEAEGRVQIIISAMQPSGIGDLYLRLEALKKKLAELGLFAEDHKKPVPAYPDNIALVTGNNTAAREDVLITLKRRWPVAAIHEYPCPVQGMEAAPRIIEELRRADNGGHDVILLVRGGGSLEDLWCFNDEELARTIYSLQTPVITGIGHEIDFTIADFVSDLRANTPTGAAEAAVPDINEVRQSLLQYRNRIYTDMKRRLDVSRVRFDHIAGNRIFADPAVLYEDRILKLDYLSQKLMRTAEMPQAKRHELDRLFHAFTRIMNSHTSELNTMLLEYRNRMNFIMHSALQKEHNRIERIQEVMIRDIAVKKNTAAGELQKQIRLLDAYSPLKILERGYGVISHEGMIINSVDMVETDDMIDVRLKDGSVRAKIEQKEKNHHEKGNV